MLYFSNFSLYDVLPRYYVIKKKECNDFQYVQKSIDSFLTYIL